MIVLYRLKSLSSKILQNLIILAHHNLFRKKILRHSIYLICHMAVHRPAIHLRQQLVSAETAAVPGCQKHHGKRHMVMRPEAVIQNSLQHASTDGGCLVGNSKAVCRIAAWIHITGFHAGGHFHTILQKSPHNTINLRQHRSLVHIAHHIILFHYCTNFYCSFKNTGCRSLNETFQSIPADHARNSRIWNGAPLPDTPAQIMTTFRLYNAVAVFPGSKSWSNTNHKGGICDLCSKIAFCQNGINHHIWMKFMDTSCCFIHHNSYIAILNLLLCHFYRITQHTGHVLHLHVPLINCRRKCHSTPYSSRHRNIRHQDPEAGPVQAQCNAAGQISGAFDQNPAHTIRHSGKSLFCFCVCHHRVSCFCINHGIYSPFPGCSDTSRLQISRQHGSNFFRKLLLRFCVCLIQQNAVIAAIHAFSASTLIHQKERHILCAYDILCLLMKPAAMGREPEAAVAELLSTGCQPHTGYDQPGLRNQNRFRI